MDTLELLNTAKELLKDKTGKQQAKATGIKEGTLFTLFTDTKKANPQATAIDKLKRYVDSQLHPKKTILVVDDSTGVRQMYNRLLKKKYIVKTASSGKKAIQMIKKKATIHLILLDYLMEGMDGVETLKEILKVNPFIPVVIQTAHGSEDLCEATMAMGAMGFIRKPPTKDLLVAKIEYTLTHARRHESLHSLRQALTAVKKAKTIEQVRKLLKDY